MRLRIGPLKKYFYTRFEFFIISIILPFCWLVLEYFFHRQTRQARYIPPVSNRFKSATLLLGSNEEKIQSIHTLLPRKSVVDWARANLKIDKINVTTSPKNIESEIVIITGDWFNYHKPHLKFFLPAILTARQIFKQKLPVWFMLGDTYNLHPLIAASIIVSKCGGAIILQQNTCEEAAKFGIPFPSGPNIWLINAGNVALFTSNKPWEERKNLVLFGVSGDDKRQNLFNAVNQEIVGRGWDVIPTYRQYDWDAYRELHANAKINIILSLRQSAVDVRLRFLRKRSSQFMVSSRVFEGFCSGNLVITNPCPVLSKLGFESGVHYLNIDTYVKNKFDLPPDDVLKSIAQAGQANFFSAIDFRPEGN